MLIWGAVWGAVLALLWTGMDGIFLVPGALLGLLAGWSLRRAIRTVVRGEIAAALRDAPAPDRPAALHPPVPDAAQAAPARDTPAAAVVPPAAAQPAAARSAPEEAPAQRPPSVAPAAAPLPARTSVPLPAVPPVVGALGQALAAARGWLLGGNLIVRIGLAILFIGLALLARYAAQAGLLPAELRLAGIGATGVALLAIGFRQRLARPGFGLALQGGGIAVLYLTVFAAFRLYQLLPQFAAFAFMVLVCALSCALALLQNARSLAFAAFAGGFATPLLLSSGGGSHVALFGYYTVLNLALLGIATRRAWRELNLLGFLATFGTAGAWGFLRYGVQDYASAQGFLIAFIAIFIATALLYARATRLQLGLGASHAVDSTLVFGTPLLGFGLQVVLVRPFAQGAAFSALGFGAAYLALAWLLRRRGAGYRVLTECFLALGVGFATLAVPLALDAQWTHAVWALEGAAAFWVGLRQARWMPRAFGLALQGLAALSYLETLQAPVGAWPLAHAGFLGAALIALAALCTAWWARQPLAHSGSRWAQGYARLESTLSTPLLLAGAALWILGWATEAWRVLPAAEVGMPARPAWSHAAGAWLVTGAALLSAAALLRWGHRSNWAAATWPSRLGLPLLGLALLAQWAGGWNVLTWPAGFAWPLALALHVALLHGNERTPTPTPGLGPAWQAWLGWQHVGTVWLVLLLLADALRAGIERSGLWGTAWASVVGVTAATAVLGLLTRWAGRARWRDDRARHAWPLDPYAERYYWQAAAPLALLLMLGVLGLAVSASGRTAPLPYVPLLNPTDLALLLALAVLPLWRATVLGARPVPPGAARWLQPPLFWGALGALGLVVLSTVWLRVAHHFFQVPWNAHALYHSFVVQSGYAILWTLIALALMIAAHRRAVRPAWLAGAALLALVVVKLIVVDLSNRGGSERIVAFIGVGVLMLVVGYFAPLPPRAAAPRQAGELAS